MAFFRFSCWAFGACLGLARVPLCAQTWDVFDAATAGFASNAVRALAAAPDGGVWAGTEYGLMHYDGVAWEQFLTSNSGLPDNDIRALAAADDGGVWVGTLGGLAHYNAGDWITYTSLNSGLPENYVRCLAVDPTGGLWVGTAGGLAWFDGGSEWHVYTSDENSYNGLQLPGLNIASIAVRPDGLVCIGTVNAGFTYLTDTTITVYTTFQHGLPDNTALGVAVDADGDRWIACPAGALLYHAGAFIGGAWVPFNTINSNIPSDALNCIRIDGAGRRIIGTQSSGVTIFSGANYWTTYSTSNSTIPGDEIFCVTLDQAGALWVGTSSGGAGRLDYTTAIERAEREGGVNVFPSPCADRLNWQWGGGSSGASYRMVDVSGRTVGAGRVQGSSGVLDVSALRNGAYLLVFSGNGAGAPAAVRFLKDGQ